MFRRNLSIILALLVVVSMLAACGGGAEPTTAPTQPPAAVAPNSCPADRHPRAGADGYSHARSD